MLKSPEQYLADLNFISHDENEGKKPLTPGERAFVEKYLGADIVAGLGGYEPLPAPRPQAPAPRPVAVKEPEIRVATKTIEVALEKSAEILQETVASPSVQVTETVMAKPTPVETPVVVEEQIEATEKVAAPAPVAAKTAVSAKTAAAAQHIAEASAEAPPFTSLKEKMKLQDEIQMVSFLVSGQLFLLPVEGVQEVLRHTEVIKVPQAPDFIAGVINRRGRITPLVYLSRLLTTNESFSYGEQSFIIVYGTEDLQIGLIIDKVSSMHMLPQDKIIWNVESKLGEGAAEFLCAIANLNDKVCGIVEPELITKKILGQ